MTPLASIILAVRNGPIRPRSRPALTGFYHTNALPREGLESSMAEG